MGKPSTMPGGLPPDFFAFGTSVSPSENTIRQPVAIPKLLRHHVCCSNGGKAPARNSKENRKERKDNMSRYSAGFLKSLESDYSIVSRETRKPTDDEIRKLKEMDAEVHRLQDEVNRLQDVIHQKRREADAFADKIFGHKAFKVKKPSR